MENAVTQTMTPPVIRSPQEALIAAADLLDSEPGWCQGTNTDVYGAHCARGAIQEIVPDFEQRARVIVFLGSHLPPTARESMFPQTALWGDICVERVLHWNDSPERTKEEV